MSSAWPLALGAAVTSMYAALAKAPVALVAPLVATYPVAMLALSAVLLRATVTRAVAGGVAITVAGVVLLLGLG